MDKEFEFRIALVKIQDRLSDRDRQQLHFLFGEDIPRRLQDNGSLETALEALQILFDRLKISSENYDYLLHALEAIQRNDCVERLRSYKELVPTDIIPNNMQEQNSVQIEAKICLPLSTTNSPSIQDILSEDTENDIMNLPKTDREPIRFILPEPDSIDFDKINLRPFEDCSQEWTEEYSRSFNLKYHPRSYQIEIIRNAIQSGNTIVCLRTGSGKTFIASLLIKYYFIKSQLNNAGRKFLTFFFVPRKAIRTQQAKAVSDVGNLRVQICEDDQKIEQVIEKNHVIITTPQKFVNSLNKQAVRLSQVNIMIFDECHNTSGANPYCEIMKYYLCPFEEQNLKELPLVIGLTATISAKDSHEKKESVEKNLVSLCSKMACKNISTACDANNIDEMNREINRPSNDQFQYVSIVKYNSYYYEYLKLYENIVTNIKHHLNSHELLDGHDMGSCGFIGQLVLLKRSFEAKGHMHDVVICDYLLLLTQKYSALKDLPFDMVIKHVLQKINFYYEQYQISVPMNNLLSKLCKTQLDIILDKHIEHPTTNSKLQILIHLLKRHTAENTKGLILVQTTFYAKTLCDYILNHPELKSIVKPTWIVGQNSFDHSLTIHDQQSKLKEFQGDTCNVLIATDIVQEGLDIPTCSYVIRYEFVSDEIGTVQSRGRARSQNSFYYLITEQNSINHQREKNNKSREEDMENAISQWRTTDKDQFKRTVADKTKHLVSEWKKLLILESERKAALKKVGKKDGLICCRKCNRELGELAWLKKRNTIYFINTPEFFNTNECKLSNSYSSFQENLVMGNVQCTCGNSLGGCQKFIDRPELGLLCALKCKQIKFKIDEQMPFIEFQQWNLNNRFDIEELEDI